MKTLFRFLSHPLGLAAVAVMFAIAPLNAARAQDEGGVFATPSKTTNSTKQRQMASGQFIHAINRTHTTATLGLGMEVDTSFGHFQFTFSNETAVALTKDNKHLISILAQWGFAIGYSSLGAAVNNALQFSQPVYVGAKFGILRDDPKNLFLGAQLMFGFINDTVAGDFGPNDVLPGVADFYLGIGAPFTYLFSNVVGLNANMEFQVFFAPAATNACLSVLAEAVLMFSDSLALRPGIQFHTRSNEFAFHTQFDVILGKSMLFFTRIDLNAGNRRIFDLVLYVGFDLAYSVFK